MVFDMEVEPTVSADGRVDVTQLEKRGSLPLHQTYEARAAGGQLRLVPLDDTEVDPQAVVFRIGWAMTHDRRRCSLWHRTAARTVGTDVPTKGARWPVDAAHLTTSLCSCSYGAREGGAP